MDSTDPAAIPLLDAKLFVPRVRDGLVPRPRLTGLDKGLADGLVNGRDTGRLTLVSAPAGFGKTTLLATWLAASDRRTAWVSLDPADAKAPSFWAYLLTALERAAPGTGTEALALLQAGQAPIETVLTMALNELSVLPEDLDLVLDDYHLADGPEIQPGMAFLVGHLPPQVHLTISTRADPVLPLARLRARGELVEVRAADLRFTADEVASYLNDTAGLDLGPADLAALESRTEGWIAALQLSALSLRDRPDRADRAAFIGDLTGNDRYVVDYLVEEVLARLPEDVRRFLLATSILDRLTGSLCDAVTGTDGGRAALETLDRQNLFLVPLDDQRRWYRYHHLFADVLHAHLLDERPREVAELHRRAARWYDEAGDPLRAVAHAQAAGDTDWAAALMELAAPHLQRDRREDVIRGWVGTLPDEAVRRRPVLALGFVGALMASNEVDGVEARLRQVEESLTDPAAVVVDEAGRARLPAAIRMYRAALALTAGDLPGTIEHADAAAGLAGGDDVTGAAASALSGLASWAGGDLASAHRRYTAAVDGLERAGHVSDVLGCTITVADLEITQGRLRQAQRTFERALALAGAEAPAASAAGGSAGPTAPAASAEIVRGVADMHVGLARIACERNDLDAATAHLLRAEELGDQAGLPQNPYRRRVTLAAVRRALGDPAGALALLAEAEEVYVGDYSPDVRPVSSTKARLLAAHGDLDAAWSWVRERGLDASDAPSYLREHEHLTLVRVLLAQHRATADSQAHKGAATLLDRLIEAAEAGGRTGSLVEALALRALVRDDVAPLERALTLAEPEGYVRVFLDEGDPMSALLRRLAKRRPDSSYLRHLTQEKVETPAPQGKQALVDPLSERELDVLRLLASDLSGPQIARELVVSLNTVRTHTKHIYAKLGVDNRRSAITSARRLGLLKITT